MTQQFTGEVKQQLAGNKDQARGCDERPRILLGSSSKECTKTNYIRRPRVQQNISHPRAVRRRSSALGPEILCSFSQKDIFFSSKKEILFSMSFEDAKEISFKDEKEVVDELFSWS